MSNSFLVLCRNRKEFDRDLSFPFLSFLIIFSLSFTSLALCFLLQFLSFPFQFFSFIFSFLSDYFSCLFLSFPSLCFLSFPFLTGSFPLSFLSFHFSLFPFTLSHTHTGKWEWCAYFFLVFFIPVSWMLFFSISFFFPSCLSCYYFELVLTGVIFTVGHYSLCERGLAFLPKGEHRLSQLKRDVNDFLKLVFMARGYCKP